MWTFLWPGSVSSICLFGVFALIPPNFGGILLILQLLITWLSLLILLYHLENTNIFSKKKKFKTDKKYFFSSTMLYVCSYKSSSVCLVFFTLLLNILCFSCDQIPEPVPVSSSRPQRRAKTLALEKTRMNLSRLLNEATDEWRQKNKVPLSTVVVNIRLGNKIFFLASYI